MRIRMTFMMAAMAAVGAAPLQAGLLPAGGLVSPSNHQPSRHFIAGISPEVVAYPIDAEDAEPRHGGNDMFRAMAGPFAGFAAATGVIGLDDYVGAAPPADDDGFSPLDEFGFVGGVTTPGGTLEFLFFDALENFHASFSVTFPTAGNFIYTINGTPANNPPIFDVPNSGFVQIVAAAGTMGQWFLSTTVPDVGTQSDLVGGNSAGGGIHSHRFRIDVPEPATLSLLAMGGIVMLRRRR